MLPRRTAYTHPFQYPGRAPRLNQSHPAAVGARVLGAGIRVAAVACPSGGSGNNNGNMLDLVTNTLATPWGGSGGAIEYTAGGPAIYANYPPANTFGCQWPVFSPSEVQTYGVTQGAIVSYRTSTFGQGYMLEDSTNGGDKVSSMPNGTVQVVVGGSNAFQQAGTVYQFPNTTNYAVPGHVYFVAFSHRCTGPAGFVTPRLFGILLDMTTGQLWLGLNGVAIGARTMGTSFYSACTYSAAGTTDKNRICAVALSMNFLTQKELYDWACDPWSLWYAPPVNSGLKTSQASLAISNAPAIMIGV